MLEDAIIGTVLLFILLLAARVLIKHYGIDFILKFISITSLILGILITIYSLYRREEEKGGKGERDKRKSLKSKKKGDN